MHRGRLILLILCAGVGHLALPCSAALAEWTFIPVPEVIVDPNEGTTVGVLPVILFSNEAKEVRSILAPDVRYNDGTGVYPTIRYFDYPTEKQQYMLQAGKATRKGEDFEANYTGKDLFDGWWNVSAGGQREQDPFERFFGFGNNTPDSNETNYSSTTNAAIVLAGLNLPYALQGFMQARLRQVRFGRGVVNDLPQLRDPSSGYSTITGVNGGTIFGTRLGLAYDSRDRASTPTEGLFGTGGIEVVNKALGSSASFVKYGLEGKAFVPLRADKKFIVALHGQVDYLLNGDDTPFYEMNSVGGVHSLRGFGSHRFTDNHRFFLQAELRNNVYEREIFGVRAHLEITPFVDLGKVFHSADEQPLSHLHPVGGLGFRAVVVPQVVAYVDLGTSGGGPAAFTGIDYPF